MMNGECYIIAGIQQGVEAGMSPGGASEVPLCQLCRLAAKNSPEGLVAYSVLFVWKNSYPYVCTEMWCLPQSSSQKLHIIYN